MAALSVDRTKRWDFNLKDRLRRTVPPLSRSDDELSILAVAVGTSAFGRQAGKQKKPSEVVPRARSVLVSLLKFEFVVGEAFGRDFDGEAGFIGI